MIGGAEAANLRGKAQAEQIAAKISQELFARSATSQLTPVPGVLHGAVELNNGEYKGLVILRNPVILWLSHSTAQIENNHRLLDGSWIGMPIMNQQARMTFQPVQIEPGKSPIEGTKYFNTMTLHLSGNIVLSGYGIKMAPPLITAPQQLEGFNLQEPDSQSIPITINF